MQDYPKLLTGSNATRVSFTQYQKYVAFSAVKNAVADAVAKQKAGNAPESGASGEADIYYWFYKQLQEAAVNVGELQKHTYAGIEIEEPPHIVLSPSIAVSHAAVKQRFPGAQNINITSNSTLVVDGSDVTFKSLKLDGTLVIKAVNGAKVTVDKLNVKNAGWQFKPLSESELNSVEQKYAIRGYTLDKQGTEQYVFTQAGEYTLTDDNKAQYANKQ